MQTVKKDLNKKEYFLMVSLSKKKIISSPNEKKKS